MTLKIDRPVAKMAFIRSVSTTHGKQFEPPIDNLDMTSVTIARIGEIIDEVCNALESQPASANDDFLIDDFFNCKITGTPFAEDFGYALHQTIIVPYGGFHDEIWWQGTSIPWLRDYCATLNFDTVHLEDGNIHLR